MLRLLSARPFAVVALAIVSSLAFAHDGEEGGDGGGGQGTGGPYPTRNMEFLGRVPLQTLGFGNTAVNGSSLWGWTDPQTSREYALMGISNGLSFVDVTDPRNPLFLGNLPTATGSSSWRDVRVYQNRAYVVSDGNGAHGMQMFDLTRLRGVNSVQSWTADGRYTGFNNAHSIAIDEMSGFAYVAGTNMENRGIQAIDVRPDSPTYMQRVGGFGADGYTHESQAITYTGPDSRYYGRQLTLNANEDTVTIVDTTDKANMTQISRTGYPNRGYTHQGVFTPDQRYFVYDDELDEKNTAGPTRRRTHVMRVDDLQNPVYLGYWEGTSSSIDHNLYIKGDLIYQANYTAGLSILKINNIENLDFTEVASIDTRPNDDEEDFRGAWNNYPYFASGTIAISDINEGLILAKYAPVPEPATMLALFGGVGALAVKRRRRSK